MTVKTVAPVALLGLLLAGRAFAQECATSVVSRASVRVEYRVAGSSAGRADALVFERSDVGILRALDSTTGAELWVYQAPELAAAAATRGLITDLAVLRFDANGDGVIDAGGGDKVWLYFGMKRGGPYYTALDVTDRIPRVLWKAGAGTLEGLGEAWSTPTITRVRIAGAAQNGERFVLIFGGGTATGSGGGAGTGTGKGNRLFMVDAATGHLLWSAGDQPGADRALTRMNHGIAARVAVLDIDGDTFADRMYAADVGGRIWRFDIWNGRGRDDLATGGVIASLGAAEPLPAPAALSDARRFFNAPDVALIQPRGSDAYYNLAIGSGDGSDARAAGVRDRFYSIRDREPFVKRSQADYDAATPLFDADLTAITASPQTARVPDDAPGWKLDLTLNGESSGEKVLAESLTANGVILFTTYQPGMITDAAGCEANGTNRVYAVRVDSGTAALDLNGDKLITTADRFATLVQQGIAGEPRIELAIPGEVRAPGPLPAPPGGPVEPGSEPALSGARCFVGAEQMNQCVPMDTVIRTFWKRTSIN